MKTKMKIIAVGAAGFMLWGAFFVNLPLGNYGWMLYDILIAGWVLLYAFAFDFLGLFDRR